MLGSLIHEAAVQRFHQLLQGHVILNTTFFITGDLQKRVAVKDLSRFVGSVAEQGYSAFFYP
jgi:hypothetical protein